MRGWILAGLLALAQSGFATNATAGEQPVVIELYTSQGCSSCPPADALLGELADRDDVIALALHVDYWDYIGWKDIFASPAHTLRQKKYAKAGGARTIYTPQMIIGGVDHVVGYKPMSVADLIQKHRSVPDRIQLDLRLENGALLLRAQPMVDLPGKMIVQIVQFSPREKVVIRKGENAGHTFVYSNVVRSLSKLADWDGAAPLTLSVKRTGSQPLAVIIQEEGPGPVLAAARVR